MIDIQDKKILHYIIRIKPQNKKAIYVEAINALNPFVKPGYRFVSVSINEKNLEEFRKHLEQGLVEAYFYI